MDGHPERHSSEHDGVRAARRRGHDPDRPARRRRDRAAAAGARRDRARTRAHPRHTPFHVRGSELLWQRWRDWHEVTIFGHEHCAARLDDRSVFRPLRGGETLDGGVRAHAIGQPRRAEIPFELPSHRALAFGDTVLEVDGELRVWPRHRDGERRRTWYEQRFLPTLVPLTRLDVERVLVTHGDPVLRHGARALAASLARAPWSRSALD